MSRSTSAIFRRCCSSPRPAASPDTTRVRDRSSTFKQPSRQSSPQAAASSLPTATASPLSPTGSRTSPAWTRWTGIWFIVDITVINAAGKARVEAVLDSFSRTAEAGQHQHTVVLLFNVQTVMVELTRGNILKAEAEALVNTVNCVGFMGKGIALQFKRAYPDNFDAYRKACAAGKVQLGRMHVFKLRSMLNPKFVINFPTKRDWRANSRYEDIEAGLKALVSDVRRLGIASLAVPPLGCGLGGLDWTRVRPIIETAFAELPSVRVLLYEPAGAPEASQMPVRTTRPKLTLARALFIRLMDLYASQSYRLTLLEIQKLAYFLQEASQPLRLRYEAAHYGPYAPNLTCRSSTLRVSAFAVVVRPSNPQAWSCRCWPGPSQRHRHQLASHLRQGSRTGNGKQAVLGRNGEHAVSRGESDRTR